MNKTKHQKAALVTGAARRIGRALAIALAEAGYDIALHFHDSAADAKKTAKEIKKTGRKCKIYSANLSKEKETQGLFTKVLRDFPNLNVLIHNASIFKKANFLNTSSKLLDENFNLHVKTPFFLTQSFAQKCKTGHVITLLDSKICQNQSEYFAYLLSKKTLLEFTQMAALALAPHIRVNAIAPGVILPPAGQSDRDLKKLVQKVPLQKKGSPEAISKALLFLLENNYITGQCLFVDGGFHLL